MNQLPLIAGALYCEPWCIRLDVHASMCQQFRDYLQNGRDLTAADSPVGPRGTPQIQKFGAVALAQVHGIIGKHLDWFESMCGGFDLSYFDEQMANVRDDPTIETLVIDFRTPGGRVTGVENSAKAIREVSESGKKVIGYTSDQCCSAGYWMLCACDEAYAEGSAIVGSISTVCAGVDSSRAWEMDGLELKLFATGSLKAAGMPGKKWTKEEEDFLRERGEAIDKDFKDFVKQRRGLGDELMEGAHWYAKHAPAGLIDGQFRTLQDVLEAVLS
jgi:ClpP class serine protease